MLKLIVGVKGTGKTKELISQVNQASNETNGSVICIEKGNKLIHEITYHARLVDTEEYDITEAASLYGMVTGMYASNHDITHIFIDSALKICNDDLASFEIFVEKLNAFSEKNSVNVVATSSIAKENLPEAVQKYV